MRSPVILLLLALPGGAAAQATPPRNRAYAEFLGPGLAYSLNYERALSDKVGWRAGVSGWPQPGLQYVLGLTGLSLRVGSPRHAAILQAGGGLAWFADVDLLEERDVWSGYAWGSVSYQFQPRPEGFFMRLSWTPITSGEDAELLWGGLALGWTF